MEARSVLEIYEAILDRQKAERQAPPETPAAQPSSEEPGGATTVSEEVFDERDPLEVEAESWLGDNPGHRAGALIRQLRESAKRAEKRGYQKALDDQAEGRRLESAWRKAEIPLRLRPLFDGVDPGDEKAIQAKIAELRADGVVWGSAVPPPPPPQVDPNLLAQQAMMAAAAGGGTPGSEGDLAYRMQKMEANPGAYSDEQHAAVVAEYNRAVQAAAPTGTSGALG